MDFLFAKLCRVFVKVKKSLCRNKFALDYLRVQTLGAETRWPAGGKAKKRRRKRCISLFNWIRMFECVGEGRKKKPVNKKIQMLKPGRGNHKKVTHLSWLLEKLWFQIRYHKSYPVPPILYLRQCIYLSTISTGWLFKGAIHQILPPAPNTV